mgnify:CR=1 FL=1
MKIRILVALGLVSFLLGASPAAAGSSHDFIVVLVDQPDPVVCEYNPAICTAAIDVVGSLSWLQKPGSEPWLGFRHPQVPSSVTVVETWWRSSGEPGEYGQLRVCSELGCPPSHVTLWVDGGIDRFTYRVWLGTPPASAR